LGLKLLSDAPGLDQRAIHREAFVRKPLQAAGLRHHAGEKLARHVVLQQPRPVAREGRVVEARLGHIHIEEPAEQQVVVELLAEHPFAAHGVERHQQRGLQQPLGWERRSPDQAVHRIEQRRELPQRRIGEFLDPSQRMLLGHPIARLHNHQHRPLPSLFTPHPPLPPPIRLATQTNYITMKFKRLSTAC
jgi:hypothetical protein